MAATPEDATSVLASARTGSSEALGRALDTCRGYLLLVAERSLDPALRTPPANSGPGRWSNFGRSGKPRHERRAGTAARTVPAVVSRLRRGARRRGRAVPPPGCAGRTSAAPRARGVLVPLRPGTSA